MTPALLNAYAVMLPRLEAEEEIRAVNVAAAGTGAMKKEHRRNYLRALERAAGPSVPARKATLKDVAALGIKVKQVEKPVV